MTPHSTIESNPITLPKLLPIAALHNFGEVRTLLDLAPMCQVINDDRWTYPKPRILDLLRSEYKKASAPGEPVAVYVATEKSYAAPTAGAVALSDAVGGLFRAL